MATCTECKQDMIDIKLQPTEILVLRDVKRDMTSYNGFTWPESGPVECDDWVSDYQCGHGLHGLPWGVGGNYCIGGDNGKYLVLRVDTNRDYNHGKCDMTDKCKFRRANVVFCGSRNDAVALIARYAPANTPINWSTQKAEDRSTQTAGYWSTQKAGRKSTQKAGRKSTQKAGHWSTQTAEDGSTQTAGRESTQTAGDGSTQTAEGGSTQTAGDGSTQTAEGGSTQKAGDRSTQTAGDRSTQTAGDGSTQKAGYWSTQTAGDWSTQTAGRKSTQKAGRKSTQKAGHWSTQTTEDGSTQTAGRESTQTAGYWSTQKAGLNSVQIQYWYEGEGSTYRTACRVVTAEMANKSYKCNAGTWELKEE